MARVGGRSVWLAWPAGVVCALVIGALLWLAMPGVPGAIEFIGTTLRGASTSAPSADGTDAAASEPATDCRSLYPDRLWSALTWTPDVLLSQDVSPPATTTALVAALGPQVRFTCTWRVEDGRSAASTVADVADGSAPVAQAALEAEGFSCTLSGSDVHCRRDRAGVAEFHDVRGDTWLASALTGWELDDYASQTAARAFGGDPRRQP